MSNQCTHAHPGSKTAPPSALTAELRLPSPCRRWLQKRMQQRRWPHRPSRRQTFQFNRRLRSVFSSGTISMALAAAPAVGLRVGHLAVHDRAQRVYRPAHSVWGSIQPGLSIHPGLAGLVLFEAVTNSMFLAAVLALNYFSTTGSDFPPAWWRFSQPRSLVLVDHLMACTTTDSNWTPLFRSIGAASSGFRTSCNRSALSSLRQRLDFNVPTAADEQMRAGIAPGPHVLPINLFRVPRS